MFCHLLIVLGTCLLLFSIFSSHTLVLCILLVLIDTVMDVHGEIVSLPFLRVLSLIVLVFFPYPIQSILSGYFVIIDSIR